MIKLFSSLKGRRDYFGAAYAFVETCALCYGEKNYRNNFFLILAGNYGC